MHAVVMRAFALFEPEAEVSRGVAGGVAGDAGAGGLADAVAEVLKVGEDGAGDVYLFLDGEVKHG